MQIKIKRPKSKPNTNRYAVPMSDEMKKEIEYLKDHKNYDINEMGRRFFEWVISESKKSEGLVS